MMKSRILVTWPGRAQDQCRGSLGPFAGPETQRGPVPGRTGATAVTSLFAETAFMTSGQSSITPAIGDHQVRIEADDLTSQLAFKPRHDTNDQNKHHNPKGDSQNGNKRDNGKKSPLRL